MTKSLRLHNKASTSVYLSNMKMLTQELILFLSTVAMAFSYITRLPTCDRYNGNFTERYNGKYFQGNVIDTVHNVSRRECTLYCILASGCLFFNQKRDGSMCELKYRHILARL